MEYSLKDLDDLCIRLNQLCQELRRRVPVVPEAVDVVQQIGSSLAWAYGQQGFWGEQFAQPFVDRRVTERLRELLQTGHPKLQAQVLQTIHILLQSTPMESTLFCNLTAGWYLNKVVTADYDFRRSEDMLHLWMTVVKDIALMMDRENLMLFFDPSSERPFPWFSESARYYHHPVAQVRTQVQATSLEIFTKLKSADSWSDSLFMLVVADSKILFTHVCCLLRSYWRQAEEANRSAERKKEKQELMRLQNDVLMYVLDVFTCDVPQLSGVLQERLLRFCVLPLLGSALRLAEGGMSQEISWPLLLDVLQTLRSSQLPQILAHVLLRPTVTEEVFQLVAGPAPQIPMAYFELQKGWGGLEQPGPMDAYDAAKPDHILYESTPIRFVPQAASERRNRLLERFQERLRELCEKGRVKEATAALKCLLQLFEALRGAQEPLETSVAEALGATLGRCLARHGEMSWCLCSLALQVLKELLALGLRAAMPPLRQQLLKPLATELLHDAALQSQHLAGQEAWLQDFQQQWLAVNRPGGVEPLGRARAFRVLLSAAELKGRDMPGKEEGEVEESARYVRGGTVYLGKMNRVRCNVRGPQMDPEEALYLIPTNFTLLLVRPDAAKAFYGEVVVAEPLRLLRLRNDENSPQQVLAVEVLSSEEPGGGYARVARSLSGHDFEVKSRGKGELQLIFSDEMRRKVGFRIISQAQYNVCQRLFDGILKFLTAVKNGA